MKMARSVSFRTSNKMTSIAHNNRTDEDEKKLKDIDKHIRWEDVDKNVTLVSRDIRDVYHEEFHTDVIKYNIRQKRKDRKIDMDYGGYYKKIRDEKGKGNAEEQREFIVQFGKKDDEPFDIETSNAMFTQYLDEFKERNPDMKVYNAVIHNDEAVPHMHINIVPVGRGYKRGVASKPSFTKALKTSGVTFDEFQDRERESLATIMKQHTNEDRKLVGTHDYVPPAQYREMMGEASEKLEEANKTLEEANKERERANKERERAKERVKEANGHVGKINEHYANIKQQWQALASKGTELDEKGRELDSRARTLENGETRLNASKSDFKRYVERTEQEHKEKEQEQALKGSELDARAHGLDSRARTLENRETSLNASKSEFEADAEQRERAIERKTEEMKAERLRLSAFLSRAQTWTVEKLESMQSKLQKRQQQLELTSDDLEDLNESGNKLQR